MCSILSFWKQFATFIWNPEKKTVCGKNGVSWLQICLGMFVVLVGGLVIFNSIRELKNKTMQARQRRHVQWKFLPRLGPNASIAPNVPEHVRLRRVPTNMFELMEEIIKEMRQMNFSGHYNNI